MPERKIIVLDIGEAGMPTTEKFLQQLDKISEMFNEGWNLDPLFNSKPIRLENAVIYHLIKYDEGEQPQEQKVASVKSVDYEQVDELIKEGYQPRDYYAKSVIMIKLEGKK